MLPVTDYHRVSETQVPEGALKVITEDPAGSAYALTNPADLPAAAGEAATSGHTINIIADATANGGPFATYATLRQKEGKTK